MGLVARHLEANGIPTVTFSCARDITEAVRLGSDIEKKKKIPEILERAAKELESL